MRTYSLAWLVLALGLCAPMLASRAAPGAAPPAVTACRFDAFTAGEAPAIYAAPDAKSRLLGKLAAIVDADNDFPASRKEHPQFAVTGFANGWFRIQGAAYPAASAPALYAGSGWLPAKDVAIHLYRDTLKAGASNASPDIVFLNGGDKAGTAFHPYDVAVTRVLGCNGSWIEVEIALANARTPDGKPVAGSGAITGWTDRACADQQKACDEKQFDYPWSPLAAGITECSMGVISADNDPRGLNVRAAPDAGAPVLGVIPPPMKIEDTPDSDTVASEVHVIGYRKGWFLVDAGPYDMPDVPYRGPRPFIGRGWVAGNKVTAELLRWWLKASPSEKSANVVYLFGGDKAPFDPQSVAVHRLMACSGDWVKVEIGLEKGMKPLMKTDAPAGSIRGWANGTCTEQLTTCDFNQDTPWSPPAPEPKD